MSEDPLVKLKERDRVMRLARDEVLRRIGLWLTERGFTRAGACHFTRCSDGVACHIRFQKLSSGRNLRVMCHIENLTDASKQSVAGPWSDAYGGRDSPNNTLYQFGWSTREEDIARCANDYCRFIEDVVFLWFREQLKQH